MNSFWGDDKVIALQENITAYFLRGLKGINSSLKMFMTTVD